MSISKKLFSKLIKEFNFIDLFNELGWDHAEKKDVVSAGGDTFKLMAVAEKKGFVVFVCSPDSRGKIPSYNIRKKIDNIITKLHFEHLIIYRDQAQSHQKWQIVIREEGKPVTPRETDYHSHQEPELLFQKLKGLFFTIDEEESIGLVDVKARVSENFKRNAEKVTKKFYSTFKTMHAKFLKFLKGIEDKTDKEWYTSLMLNRLMFIYFIQKKGFLNNDRNYLFNKLKETQKKYGKNRFYSFYRTFLLLLFHKGLGSSSRDSELTELIGDVPYLNGGLFDIHQLELEYENIQIDDKAFERIFDFFDQYEWHLDTRIKATGKEINPDVIGFIFEKYINDRASMGAYYTKEDITEYISKNSIISFLFDEIKEKSFKEFESDGEVWKMLKESGSKYIYHYVKHGIEHDLPVEIAEGIEDVKKRKKWNRYAPSKFALQKELWRDVIDRRKQYIELIQIIKNGTITNISDFITYNLNIRQFAQDIIKETDNPKLIEEIYKEISEIRILDPTCGSGAFLFAALNILEPLYLACIQRMESFVNESSKGEYRKIREKLKLINSPEHPNKDYFIFKSIILNNLFGVDIMNEAVEIAKLRLFLKLVSTVDINYSKRNMGLEPLPDIDFNIRFGNSLIGFASENDLKDTIYNKDAVSSKKILRKFQKLIDLVSYSYKQFLDSQLVGNMVSINLNEKKNELRKNLKNLNDSLNKYQAYLYGKNVDRKPNEFEKWKEGHKPFHWYAEFYGIIHGNGGFDVVIGNPPYVEYKNIKNDYEVKGFVTKPCGDLYAFVVELSKRLTVNKGRIGFIVPISMFGTDGFKTLQTFIFKNFNTFWASFFSNRPAQLFDGAQKRLTILLGKKGSCQKPIVFTSNYIRWLKVERDFLFESRIKYSSRMEYNLVFPTSLEKLGSDIEISIFSKMLSSRESLATSVINSSSNSVYYTRKFGYFLSFLDEIPRIIDIKTGKIKNPSELKELGFRSTDLVKMAIGFLSSTTFFWFWNVLSDCRNLNKRDLLAFPLNPEKFSERRKSKFISLSNKYLTALHDTSRMMTKSGLKIETFNYSTCKGIIDKIDCLLAEHYDFNDEELEFILNYDIKYRIGKEL